MTDTVTDRQTHRQGDTVTLESLLRSSTELLAASGVDSPRADAELLAAHVLGASRGEVAAWAIAGRRLDPLQSVDLRRLSISRATRTPLQYLTGTTTFRSVELQVGHGVFLPRPETELVAGAAIDAARAVRPGPGEQDGHPLVVDLCTGSGAIAAAVATEIPGATVHAVEADPEAAWWAAANLDPRGVALHVGDAATALPDLDGRADVVVSNPPYVPDGRIPAQAEARRDPGLALYGGGADGMRLPTVVAATAARLLRPGGTLVMEHDDTQGELVGGLLRRGGRFSDVQTREDLNGRPRYTIAARTDGTMAR
ncbi:peptide chain release factor N(5)-glutamine methyltransferase [Citricoccus sp. K5]|uniref:peptide chain release factor N(5)-glutamine methyltransferase n=1 Tax=Citricoccus sp. K5 TaxID=2653135 RepID=UPI0012F45002|nr:peptide chain release factor N(5)-glutamine methyltransferase [Citricoccus sp. K5]VXB16423.1 Release factor glutamine methyltransferase [Citricoccus sp. K5]